MADKDEAPGRGRKVLPVDGQGTVTVEHEPRGPRSRRSLREEDIVDAEVVDESEPEREPEQAEPEASGPAGPGRSRAWRDAIRDRVRAHFGPGDHEKREQREKQRQVDTERLEWDDDGLTEREHALKLRSRIRIAGDTYMQSIRDSGLSVPGYGTTEEKTRKISRKNQVYVQMMMQSCVAPLARGVRPTTIVQAAGMFVAMRMLSQDFRDQVGQHTGQLKDAIQRHSDKKIAARVARIEQGIEDREQMFSDVADPEERAGLIGSTNPRDYLSKKHRRLFDDLQRRERGNREVFTPESAAMTEVALLEDAYWTMRDPSTDNKEVSRGYRAMRSRLHQQMADDGLDRQEVVTRARMILAERMEHEPEVRTMLNGVAHGRIVLSEPRQERVAGSDEVRRVWRGEVEDQLGRRLPDSGMFTLREPMSADAHQVAIAATMESSIMHGCSQPGGESLRDSIYGYLVGFASKKQGFDLRGKPEGLRKRTEQAHLMTASMEMDGLDEEEQRRVYSNAFVDAMQAVREKNPELNQDFEMRLGKDWQERVRAAVEDPEAFYAEQARREEDLRGAYAAYRESSKVYQQGPEPGPAETMYTADDRQPA